MRKALAVCVLFFAANAYAQVSCESYGNAYRECRVGNYGKVVLDRELSNGLCAEESTWGTRSVGVVWVSGGCRAVFRLADPEKKPARPTARTIACESKDEKRHHCPAETTWGVALVKQLGQGSCTLDRSWGFDEKGVWVTGGCSGQFALGGFRLEASQVPPAALRLVCESADGGDRRCPVDALRGAGLIRQIGEGQCVLNRTWGYDSTGIWVTGGCRAEFAALH